LFANLEYEVDELRRDIQVLELASSQIDIQFVHDRTIVEPDTIKTNEDKTYSVYSPYQRKWIAKVNENLPYYLNDWPLPTANAQLPGIQGLSTKVPEYVAGFQLGDDEAAKMREVWPHSEEAAAHVGLSHLFLCLLSQHWSRHWIDSYTAVFRLQILASMNPLKNQKRMLEKTVGSKNTRMKETLQIEMLPLASGRFTTLL